jgi:GT2 family glycosyltransferase
MSDIPALSVVLVTPHRYDTLRKTMQSLRAQSVGEQMEVVIVSPSTAALGFDSSERAGFANVQLVEVGTQFKLGGAKAAGVRAATAPIVVFAEDHCYPAAGWAEALIAAHEKPWAAVGPSIGNANPQSLVSWTNLLIAYGRWLEPMTSQVIDDVPGHNSSYKRDLLLAIGPELDAMLTREGSLHERLRAQGHQLYLESAAKAYHLNPTLPMAWLKLRFNAGRLFAAMRSRSWSAPRRAVYIAGSPLIPLTRLPQLLRIIRRSGRQGALMPAILPVMLLALMLHTLGEVAGYVLGEGDTREQLANFEFDRLRQLSERDRMLLRLSQAG